jgi:hypothetical protein
MDWSPDFCLACDRQTDGGVYCGEACRLTEYEKANSGSEASSPASQRGPISWSTTTRTSNNFYLPPAYDFAAYKSQAYGITTRPRPSPTQRSRPQSSPVILSSKPVLTPSSSQSSLFSMRSSSLTSSEPIQLSEISQRTSGVRQLLRSVTVSEEAIYVLSHVRLHTIISFTGISSTICQHQPALDHDYKRP